MPVYKFKLARLVSKRHAVREEAELTVEAPSLEAAKEAMEKADEDGRIDEIMDELEIDEVSDECVGSDFIESEVECEGESDDAPDYQVDEIAGE